MKPKLLIPALIASLSAACGGAGSNDNSPNSQPPPSVTLMSITDENSLELARAAAKQLSRFLPTSYAFINDTNFYNDLFSVSPFEDAMIDCADGGSIFRPAITIGSSETYYDANACDDTSVSGWFIDGEISVDHDVLVTMQLTANFPGETFLINGCSYAGNFRYSLANPLEALSATSLNNGFRYACGEELLINLGANSEVSFDGTSELFSASGLLHPFPNSDGVNFHTNTLHYPVPTPPFGELVDLVSAVSAHCPSAGTLTLTGAGGSQASIHFDATSPTEAVVVHGPDGYVEAFTCSGFLEIVIL